MIDKTLIVRKINLISEDFEALKSLAKLSYKDYMASPANEIMTERYLERMIGRMIDIGYHIITEKDRPPPSDYFKSFLHLAKVGALPPDFARQIAPCAGLRNRIVHEYDEIDSKKIYDGLKTALRDVPLFLKYVSEFVDKT